MSDVTALRVVVGPFVFLARLEERAAPGTCARFTRMLPFRQQIIHARWSGEACWVPLGDLDTGLRHENATSFPAPGQILFYPGGPSEAEILVPYGSVCFASKVGQLAGNHFLTVTDGCDRLAEMGHMVLWQGAQDIVFEALI